MDDYLLEENNAGLLQLLRYLRAREVQNGSLQAQLSVAQNKNRENAVKIKSLSIVARNAREVVADKDRPNMTQAEIKLVDSLDALK